MSNSINYLFNHRQFDPNVISLIADKLDLRDRANFYTALVGEKPLNEHRSLRTSVRKVFEKYLDESSLESSFPAIQDKNDLLLRKALVRVVRDVPSQSERGLLLGFWMSRADKSRYEKGLLMMRNSRMLEDPIAQLACFKRLVQKGVVKTLNWFSSGMSELEHETIFQDNVGPNPQPIEGQLGTPLSIAARKRQSRVLRFLVTDLRFAPYITQEMFDEAFWVARDEATEFMLGPDCPFKPDLKTAFSIPGKPFRLSSDRKVNLIFRSELVGLNDMIPALSYGYVPAPPLGYWDIMLKMMGSRKKREWCKGQIGSLGPSQMRSVFEAATHLGSLNALRFFAEQPDVFSKRNEGQYVIHTSYLKWCIQLCRDEGKMELAALYQAKLDERHTFKRGLSITVKEDLLRQLIWSGSSVIASFSIFYALGWEMGTPDGRTKIAELFLLYIAMNFSILAGQAYKRAGRLGENQ